MKRSFQNVARWLSHTHTLAIVMYLLLQSVVVNAQNPGDLQILAPIYDPSTGITRCTINWVNNVNIPQIRGLYLETNFIGNQICLNNSTASVPSVIHPGFNVSPYNRQFGNGQLIISRGGLPSSPLFSLPTPRPYAAPPNTSFLVLYFRALPSSVCTLTISGWVRFETGPLAYFNTQSLSYNLLAGARIAGDFVKPDGAPCDLGSGIGQGLLIPGVSATKVATVALGACFPGVANETELFQGQYEFLKNPLYETYTITPSKISTDVCCGVTSNDLDWAIENIFNPNIPPWKAIAADINGNNFYSSFDIHLIRKCVLGLPFIPGDLAPDWKPWRFVPWDGYTWPGYDPLDLVTQPLGNYASTITTTATIPNILAPFWGVKRGDVDGDCQDCGPFFAPGDGSERAKPLNQKVVITDLNLPEGQEAYIPVRASALNQIRHFGIELLFDPKQLEVLSVENGYLEEEFVYSDFATDQNGTAVRFSWFTLESKGVDMPENEVLFYVKIRAKKDVKSLKEAVWQNLEHNANWLYADGRDDKMVFETGVMASNTTTFSATLIGGNPVGTSPSVDITLPFSAFVNIKLIDGKGLVVKSVGQFLSEGLSNIPIVDFPPSSGVYTLCIQSSHGVRTLRFVKI
jgi:hypothetical protein